MDFHRDPDGKPRVQQERMHEVCHCGTQKREADEEIYQNGFNPHPKRESWHHQGSLNQAGYGRMESYVKRVNICVCVRVIYFLYFEYICSTF